MILNREQWTERVESFIRRVGLANDNTPEAVQHKNYVRSFAAELFRDAEELDEIAEVVVINSNCPVTITRGDWPVIVTRRESDEVRELKRQIGHLELKWRTAMAMPDVTEIVGKVCDELVKRVSGHRQPESATPPRRHPDAVW